jgi:hypothetical protein
MRPRLAIVRTGPEQPPFVLRWIWYFAPVLVAAAMGGMFLAARSARAKQPIEAFSDGGARLLDGARVRRGESLHVVVAPGRARYVTFSTSDGQVTRLGPLASDDNRVELPIPATTPGLLRVSASFDADRVVSLAFVVE